MPANGAYSLTSKHWVGMLFKVIMPSALAHPDQEQQSVHLLEQWGYQTAIERCHHGMMPLAVKAASATCPGRSISV